MVRCSHDGGQTWRIVAANVHKESWQIRSSQLPGGDNCIVQVVASSGIRTTIAQTGSFTSPLKPRAAFILSPIQDEQITQGNQVILKGGAFSSNFGLGEMNDVEWHSNLDGLLGRGLELVANDLSSGLHTITMTAPDGLKGIAKAAVTIKVVAV